MNAVTETKADHATAFAAVVAAKASVKRIAKDNRNAEQKYDFASVDDFLAMVGPITAAQGLLTVIDEDSIEFIEKPGKYGPTQWVRVAYQITTYHASGSHLPTVRRHVEVIRSGPQAYGAAQSYILKQYYRSLLDIPTGDNDDPDFGRQPESAVVAAPRPQERQAPRNAGPDPAQIAIESLASAETLDALAAIWASVRDVQRDPRVIAAKDARKAALSGALADDEIPY